MQHELRLDVFPTMHIDTWVRIHPSARRVLLRGSEPECRCRCGWNEVPVRVLTDDSVSPDRVEISTRVLDRLSLPIFPDHVRASVRSGQLVIGPVIGILANPHWNDKARTVRPSKQLPAVKKLLEVGADSGALCYMMRAKDVDFQRMRTVAYLWTGARWERHILPLPDVIYDQVISRKVEFDKQHAAARRRLSELYGKRIFNDGFFDKWEVYQWLSKDAGTRGHMPDTQPYVNAQTAASFLQRYPVTFLKPVHGSLGLGIVRVVRLTDGYQYAVKRLGDDALTGSAASAAEVVRVLQKRLAARPYLLQQGINLALFRGRPFDIRILLQRDGTGQWRRTKAFARVAKPGEFTSNLSNGGEALPMETVLSGVFGDAQYRQRVCRSIYRLARTVADVVERQSEKHYGELGIDIGVDSHGGIWVIEVNSKPRKALETERGRRDLVELAFARPMQYAMHVALTS
jgi:hypothetical protein